MGLGISGESGGGGLALAGVMGVFAANRGRLKAMVRLRLDRRLQGRVDPSDVVQETGLEAARRFAEYAAQPAMPPFLWLRFLTLQQIVNIHRRQLGAQRRDVSRELSLQHFATPNVTTMVLAAQLLGRLTSPVDAALRAERQAILHDALERIDDADREMIALRHFEELTNQEIAELLGLHKDAASKRYLRAMKRLRDLLASYPGFFEAGGAKQP